MHLEPSWSLCNAPWQQGPWKCVSTATTIHVTSKAVTSVNSRDPPQTYSVRNWRRRSSAPCFHKPSKWSWYLIKLKIHCLRKWSSWGISSVPSSPQILTICPPILLLWHGSYHPKSSWFLWLLESKKFSYLHHPFMLWFQCQFHFPWEGIFQSKNGIFRCIPHVFQHPVASLAPEKQFIF